VSCRYLLTEKENGPPRRIEAARFLFKDHFSGLGFEKGAKALQCGSDLFSRIGIGKT
jgi:hypothetical protein